MKKAFGQTVRDIKRGVNKTVLKVPSIEQKILDATSNEPWGPHGTHLADIAQASKNYHDYQMIMSVVWKRLNDTGKNWRHVFKGLTVLEYLVVNGSERVIEDIREHAYQISILSSFQYIDSTGRDQGSNVRKKSQSLVALVNDKEKIREEREKAAANRDKLRNTSGGPRDDDHNGYGRERESGDKYGRYSEDQYGRDGYKDDEYRGRSKSNDVDYGTRSQSSDRERERAYEDDSHHSSRGSNSRVEDSSPDGSRLESKVSGQNHEAPPSYEDVVSAGHSPDDKQPPAPNHQEAADASNFVAPPPPAAATPPPAAATPPPEAATAAVTSNMENDGFDFFDPRGATPAAPSASSGAEMDLLGSLSDSFSNALALVPSEPHPPTNPNPNQTPFDDPFGDGPFKAVQSTDGYSAQSPASPFTEPSPMTENSMGFGDAFDPMNDILADILPPPGPVSVIPSQTVTLAQPNVFHSQNGQSSAHTGYAPQTNPFSQTGFLEQSDQSAFSSGFPGQFGQPISQLDFSAPGGESVLPPNFQAAQDGQSVLKNGFPAANGGQSVLQPGFPAANGGQSVLPLGFPAAQSGQHGFPASNGSQPGFQVAQGGQSVLPPSFTAAQGDHPSFPTAQSGQPGFPTAQGGQPGFPTTQGGQPGFPTTQGGQPVFPTTQGGQPGFPTAQGGQPGFPASQSGQPGFLAAQSGQSVFPPSFMAGQGGQPGFPTFQGGQPGFPTVQGGEPGFPAAQGGQSVLATGFPAAQGGQSGFTAVKANQPVLQPGFPAAHGGQSVLPPVFAGGQNPSLNGFSSQSSTISQAGYPNSNGQPNNFYGGFQPQGSAAPVPSFSQVTVTPQPQYNASNFYQPPAVTPSAGALAIVPQQPTKEKFETKSTVWADTLNRGLVNLNISGSKTNPLSDIGIDFEAINRKEKRMEKPSKTPATSNLTMGKAMGSGSGIGRAGATALRPAQNQMAGLGLNQPMGMNNMPQNMGIGMNIGQGFQMQQQQQPPPAAGFPPGNYNPMEGRGGGGGGGYGQQPYGGYR